MEELTERLYEFAKSDRFPNIVRGKCENCGYLVNTIGSNNPPTCPFCSKRSVKGGAWPFVSTLVLWKVAWAFLLKSVQEFESPTQASLNYWGAPKEAVATIIMSKTFIDTIIQETLRNIAVVRGLKGFDRFFGKPNSYLESAYYLVTGKDLKKETADKAKDGFRDYYKDVQKARDLIIHSEKKVTIDLETVKKAIAVACESSDVCMKLINEEVKEANKG